VRDANTAACVLKREQAAIRGSGGDGVQGGPAGSLRGRTSAVTLANLLNMHCHSMSSRSGQPRARLAACQTHLAPLPVHAPWPPTSADGAPPLGSASKLRSTTSSGCRRLSTGGLDAVCLCGRYSDRRSSPVGTTAAWWHAMPP